MPHINYRRESHPIKPNLDCNYTFSIGLAPNRTLFGVFCNYKNVANLWGKICPICGEKCAQFVGENMPNLFGKICPICRERCAQFVGKNVANLCYSIRQNGFS